MQKKVLSLLVDNNPGVTSRISGLFSRRGYNIDSFSSGVTTDERFTRITIVCSGEANILEQIVKQVEKLEDVQYVKELEPSASVIRELVLVKVAVGPDQRQGVISIAELFRANVVDVSNDSLVIEMTGSKNKVEAFVSLMMDYEILELARTGVTGLSRGTQDVRFL